MSGAHHADSEPRRPAPDQARMPELGELTFIRDVAASRALAFDCLTQPAHLAHFWGPTGTRTPLENITVELRPGGAFETVMVNEGDGATYPMRAVYLEVRPPERLVWVEPDSGMLTTVTFTALTPTTTRVLIHQTNVPEANRSAAARAGQQTSHRRFAAYLAGLNDRRF